MLDSWEQKHHPPTSAHPGNCRGCTLASPKWSTDVFVGTNKTISDALRIMIDEVQAFVVDMSEYFAGSDKLLREAVRCLNQHRYSDAAYCAGEALRRVHQGPDEMSVKTNQRERAIRQANRAMREIDLVSCDKLTYFFILRSGNMDSACIAVGARDELIASFLSYGLQYEIDFDSVRPSTDDDVSYVWQP